MNYYRYLFICLLSTQFLFQAGCAAIPRFSVVEIKPDTDNTFVLMPPSESLLIYDSALAEHWYRTFNQSAQIKKSIAIEIDARAKREISTKSVLAGIGAILALSNTLYAIVEDTPDKKVVGILSTLSGTSMIALLPAFTQDERLVTLKEKLIKIKALENKSVLLYSEIETKLTEKGNIETVLDPDLNPLFGELTDEDKKELYIEISKLIFKIDDDSKNLRKFLIEWANEAQ